MGVYAYQGTGSGRSCGPPPQWSQKKVSFVVQPWIRKAPHTPSTPRFYGGRRASWETSLPGTPLPPILYLKINPFSPS